MSTEIHDNQALSPPSKRLTVFNALGVSSKFFVSSLAAFVLLLSDSWAPLYYIIAAVSNGVLSKVIKKTLKQPRPLQSDKGGYGMPSSHAQSFFFFLTVLVLHHQRIFPNGYLALVSCSVLAMYAVVASSWRVTTRLHTVAQTVVGGVLGTLVAMSASRIESSTVHLLQRFFVMMTGETDTHHAVLTAKICITLAAMLFICKREIQALIDSQKIRKN
jgi:membrane-associated phospholipid phosphatase